MFLSGSNTQAISTERTDKYGEQQFLDASGSTPCPFGPTLGAPSVALNLFANLNEGTGVLSATTGVMDPWFEVTNSLTMDQASASQMSRRKGLSAQSAPNFGTTGHRSQAMNRRVHSAMPAQQVSLSAMTRWYNDANVPFSEASIARTSLASRDYNRHSNADRHVDAAVLDPSEYLGNRSIWMNDGGGSYDPTNLTANGNIFLHPGRETTADAQESFNEVQFDWTALDYGRSLTTPSATCMSRDPSMQEFVPDPMLRNHLFVSSNAAATLPHIAHDDLSPMSYDQSPSHTQYPHSPYPSFDDDASPNSFFKSFANQLHLSSPYDHSMLRTPSYQSTTSDTATSVVHIALPDPVNPQKQSDQSVRLSNNTQQSDHAMQRTSSSDSAKVAISRKPAAPQRAPVERFYCRLCNKIKDGFRGEHELQRHIKRSHPEKGSVRTYWLCKDLKGQNPEFLAKCKACSQQKKYFADYNCAAHLRRIHFHPRKQGRRAKTEVREKRGGKGGGEDPHIDILKENWMQQCEEYIDECDTNPQPCDEETEDRDQQPDDLIDRLNPLDLPVSTALAFQTPASSIQQVGGDDIEPFLAKFSPFDSNLYDHSTIRDAFFQDAFDFDTLAYDNNVVFA